MDASIFTKWFDDHFVSKYHKGLEEFGLPPKALLVLGIINSIISNDCLVLSVPATQHNFTYTANGSRCVADIKETI